MGSHRFVSTSWGLACVVLALAVFVTTSQAEQRTDLPDGSYVMVDPDYDLPGATPVENVGIVRRYDPSGNLQRELHGSTANDRVGSGGVTVIGNDYFLVSSPSWDHGAVVDAGALTFSKMLESDMEETLSPGNSIVGSSSGDLMIGGSVIMRGLTFMVCCPQWDNGIVTDAGAVIIGGPYDYYSPFKGFVSPSNALVGSSANDQVGGGGMSAITDVGIVVQSPSWDNGGAADAGAVTLLIPPGSPGATIGVLSSANSLVGASANDRVGSGGLTPLPGLGLGVHSPLWDNAGAVDAGAFTLFGPGVPVPSTGVVSAANSLVGSSADDQLGSGGVTVLNGMSLLIRSPLWDNGGVANAGAVTLMGPSWSGLLSAGVVSATNSVVGSTADDQVGSGGATVVEDKGIVVSSPLWDNGSVANAGAVTLMPLPWISLSPTGAVSAANSLVGSSVDDQVGSGGVSATDGIGVVVRSPLWDNGGAANGGAVTMMIPPWIGPPSIGTVSATNSLIGSSTGDQVGSGGVIVFDKIGVVVSSPLWDNGSSANAGAVTYMSRPGWGTPSTGAVSASNSLVGASTNDQVGSGGIVDLDGFTFLVRSPQWDNGSAVDAGAVTFMASGVGLPSNGPVSAANSLVGTSTNDQVGSGGIVKLGGPTFLVRSPQWDNGSAADAGAVTLIDPIAGLPSTGPVSATNSLVGASANDQVGSGEIKLLDDGMFLVSSPEWSNGAGAVTLGRPLFIGPFAGTVSAANSLVGSTADDKIGSGGLTAVGDGCFLVQSPLWNNGSAADAGALTLIVPSWESAFGGVVSAANSLVGSSAGDQVGGIEVVLVEGTVAISFIVRSPMWDNGGSTDAGAVTVGGPPWTAAPFKGAISAANSLVGASTNDQIGSGGITGAQGVGIAIFSPRWDNGSAADAGAVTFTSVYPGFSPTVGVVSAANSLVGSSTNDQVGSGGSASFGLFGCVIYSPRWNNGAAIEAGAITVTGSLGLYQPPTGVLSSANSLVGSSNNDQVGSEDIIVLANGQGFLLHSPWWDNGPATDAGAVTLVDHVRATGVISSANSLVGSSSHDQIGSGGSVLMGPDSFIVLSPAWDNGSIVDAGAATVGGITRPFAGAISSTNSYVGSTANDQVGSGGAKAEGQGYGLVHSPLWDHRTAVDAGAVTWVSDSSTGGFVTKDNSLVGSHPNDRIGSGGITILANPLVLIESPNWCYGAGAVTRVTPPSLTTGVVTSYNSTTGVENAWPEFALLQSAVEIPENSTRSWGAVTVGGSTSMTFIIKNQGADDLRILAIPIVGNPAPPEALTITGADAAMFKVSAYDLPSPMVTGDSMTFTITFKPTSAGAKTAKLAIFREDHLPGFFYLTLNGSGEAVSVSDWRQTHFGSSANSGPGADTSDFDHDGIANLVEYALGLHPGQVSAGQVPAPARAGGDFVLNFTEPGQITGITYGAEWSPSLSGGSWLPVTDTGTPPQHFFSVPVGTNKQMFMRLKVTASP